MTGSGTVLIVGADGFIGSALSACLADAGVQARLTSRRHVSGTTAPVHLDLADDPSQWKLPTDITFSFLLAGRPGLDDCRANPTETRRVNVEATEVLARKLIDAGSRIVFLSTNLVYDGSLSYRKAGDRPCPQTEYGRQKAETEQRLLKFGDNVTIVRLSKVLCMNHGLLKDWRQSLTSNHPIHPFSDLLVAPIALDFVVAALVRIIDSQCSGIIQISGSQDVSYETIAVTLSQQLGAGRELVQSIKADNSGKSLEAIPRSSTLDASTLEQKLGLKLPQFWSFLKCGAAV